MDGPSWNISATAGAWAACVLVIVLSQGLMSAKTADVLVPSLLILGSVAAIWNGLHWLRRTW
jgi:hypothetical protein